MSRPRKYRPGARIKTMAALDREFGKNRYLYLHARPIHPGWLRSMTWQTLKYFVTGGSVRKAVENKTP